MKKFHVEIRDNETGKLEVNMDSDAYIGAFHDQKEDRLQSVCALNCNPPTVIGVIKGVKKVIEGVYAKYPELKNFDSAVVLESASGKEEKAEKSPEEKQKPSDRPDMDKALKALGDMRGILDELKDLKKSLDDDKPEKKPESPSDPFEMLMKHLFS